MFLAYMACLVEVLADLDLMVPPSCCFEAEQVRGDMYRELEDRR